MNLYLPIALVTAFAIAAVTWMSRVNKRLRENQLSIESNAAELERRGRINLEIEDRYRALFESVPVAIIVSTLDGTLIDANREAIRVFGYADRTEMMRVNMKTVYVNPAERERSLRAPNDGSTSRPAEHLLRRKDGTTFPALTRNHVSRESAGGGGQIEGFVTDLSEYKRLDEDRRAMEHEQRISTRLKSVGALAAGIAHEINTPMQFVSDSVYFLKTAITELDALWPELGQLSKDPQLQQQTAETIERIEATMSQIDVGQLVIDANQSAERALEGIRRVTKIIRAMREFAHPDNGEHTNVDINNALETTLTVCKNVYKEVADVETDFGPLPPVLCQYGEMNQVFLNIIVNAAHAIEAARHDGGKGLIRIATSVEESWAVIRISDNGTGIPDSVKARIFDPFFTTKEVGKGTGQGLAIVQSVIVERHKGRISVESQVGRGTTFILRLPLERTDSPHGVAHEQEA